MHKKKRNFLQYTKNLNAHMIKNNNVSGCGFKFKFQAHMLLILVIEIWKFIGHLRKIYLLFKKHIRIFNYYNIYF